MPSRSRIATRAALACACAAVLAACGGSSPTGPGTLPSPDEGFEVAVVAYYDENANGFLDAGEVVRLGNVDVEIGGRRARTAPGTGRAVITGLPAGTYAVNAASLPPFYAARAGATVSVPQAAGANVLLPATLAIGSNRPNTYMAFGDSISTGDGSSDGTGYRAPLQALLDQALNAGTVLDRGAEGTTSAEGAGRITRGLRALTPAYTLILYGTNDWNFTSCQAGPPCFTLDSLRVIVEAAKAAQSQPFVATIIPGNPSDPRVPPERNAWVAGTDDLIRGMAAQEGAVLVDLQKAFLAQGDLTQLFSDHIHPNDRGYSIIANEWFKAITGATASSSGAGIARAPAFGFRTPGVAPRRLIPRRAAAGFGSQRHR